MVKVHQPIAVARQHAQEVSILRCQHAMFCQPQGDFLVLTHPYAKALGQNMASQVKQRFQSPL